jgi:phosphatidate phosphatase APP1
VRGKRIAMRVGDEVISLAKPSQRNGQFLDSLRLDADRAKQLAAPSRSHSCWLRLEVVSPASATARVPGQVNLIDETGVSVISDIDDTIKHSNVANRRELLRNTFLREFRPVSGMAELYSQWHEQGAAFHYVSSSPWQLFDSLYEFLSTQEFPMGSMHLQPIRWRDPSLLRLFAAQPYRKRRAIATLVRAFAHRKFVLIGDSGERDIEIYGSIARRFPTQIDRILIRRVEGRAVTARRLARAFRNVPTKKWRFFSEASELMNLPLGPPF